MNIYVDELPKDCECCSLLSCSKMKINSNGKYVDTKCCVLGQFYKYTTIDDEINSCPLKIIPSDDKRMLEFFESIKIQQVIAEGRARQLEEQLSKAIVPKFEIGQRVYMIPNEFNGLNNLTEYEVLDYNLSSLGVRFNLTIINKQKGIEPFYCASEDMIGLSIFSTKEEAESKLKELKGEGEKMIKNRCLNCPYNNEGNGCGNEACIQEAVMFDVSIDELKGVHKNEKS